MKYIATLLLFLFSSCQTEIKTNEKVVSPGKIFIAISTTELSGGAAGSVADQVYVLKDKNNYTSNDLVFESLHTKGLEFYWSNKNKLIIAYEDADIIHFNNKKMFNKNTGKYRVEVILEKKK